MNPVEVALDAARALERAGVPYAIGGSVASTLHGEPRATMDVDIVVHMSSLQVDELAKHLDADFLVDRRALMEAAVAHEMYNVIHERTLTKVDLYIREASGFDAAEIERAQRVQLDPASPQLVRVVTAEDVVLQKLLWFRKGDEVSDLQWRDVLGVLETCGATLDDAYLDEWASRLDIADLLARARAACGEPD